MIRWMKLDDGTVINPAKITHISNIENVMGLEGFRINFGPKDYVFMSADYSRREKFLLALVDRINQENK